MYKALHLSPMIPSFRIQETAAFFTGVLDFNTVMGGDYVILQKDSLNIHILNAGSQIGEMEFYLEVEDIDDLWLQIKGRLNGIKVREPLTGSMACAKCISLSRKQKPCYLSEALSLRTDTCVSLTSGKVK